MALEFFNHRRGFIGFLARIVGSDGETRGGVIPAMSLVDSTGAEAPAGTPTSPIYTQGTSTTPAALAAATALDARSYGSAMFQVAGLGVGDTIAITESLNGTNYVPAQWYDAGGNTGTGPLFTITTDGIYNSINGGVFFKWTPSNAVSPPTVTERRGS